MLRRAANGASTKCPTYTASPASGANHLASYRYGGNVGAYNNGRLIEVNWGLNPTANKDTFAYDSEGRLSQQNRLVAGRSFSFQPVSYTHLRAHETVLDLVCRLLLEKKKKTANRSRTEPHDS